MEEEESNFRQLTGHIKEYARENYNLAVLNIYDKVSKAVSSIASALVFWVVIVFSLLFISIGFAWWIGHLFANVFIGFFIIGGLYLLITILLIAKKDTWIRVPVINYFLKNITDEKD
jgi:hypothetical protein